MSESRRRAAPLRVLIAKPGLDGHDRGAKVVARALMDAGMEVIYTGLHRTVPQVVSTAVQEDVDAIGLSYLNGTHLEYTRQIIAGLREQGQGDQVVVCGGIIPRRDVPGLQAMGVAAVFLPGTPLADLIAFLQENCTRRQGMAGGGVAR